MRAGNRGGVVRREPVENVHPVVQEHPVTGGEALYVNRQFAKRVVGFKREESGTHASESIPCRFADLIQTRFSTSCTTTSTRASTPKSTLSRTTVSPCI